MRSQVAMRALPEWRILSGVAYFVGSTTAALTRRLFVAAARGLLSVYAKSSPSKLEGELFAGLGLV